MNSKTEINEIEYNLLIQAVKLQYGYDFANYSIASFRRRIANFMMIHNVNKISELIPLLLHNTDEFELFLQSISVTVTEMFRDPEVYLGARKQIIPVLKNKFESLNIWNAGCATGEETYSLAILLYEEDLLDKVELFATDINNRSLKIAKEAIYSSDQIKVAISNYNRSGNKNSFNNYYFADKEGIQINQFISNHISFFNHNLTIDQPFNLMQMIVCRNVLIYFNKKLQDHVLQLFDSSLELNGFLWLGTKETLDFSIIQKKYRLISDSCKIYQKII